MSKILKVVGASWLQTKISSYVLGVLGIIAIMAVLIGLVERNQDDGNYSATVFYSEKTGYRIEYWGQSNELADIPRGVARAYFRRDVDTTGWSLLEVETNSSYPDDIQAYAAGIVEGALTWYLIHTHLENTIRAKCEDTPLEKNCSKLRDALDKSVKIWKTHAAEREEDPFWHHVSLHYTQIGGIFTGWKHGVERSQNEYETDISDLYWLNSISEVAEIQHKMNIVLGDTALDNLPSVSSAFLRVINETTDGGIVTKKLFVAHNAAGSYSSMTRILKRYKLNYHLTATDSSPAPGSQIDFSGYPGSITSQDEFYILRGENHRMAITGTPLRNYNKELWKNVNINKQVPIGPRISAANRLAVNVTTWGHTLAKMNSGTACKQWLVVDYNKFDRLHDPIGVRANITDMITEVSIIDGVKYTNRHGSHRANGLLWLIEQVPGLTHARDLSESFLEQGYWATYGIPLSKLVAESTHIKQMEKQHGRIFSHFDSPKAAMFRRSYENATTLSTIIKLMRQNNITALNKHGECSGTDCLVVEEGYWSVMGVRGDLVNNFKASYGVIDTKVISGAVNRTALDLVTISGPTYTAVRKSNTTTPLNKGNVASLYTEQFNNQSDIDGLEIRDMVKQQQEDEQAETLENLNKDAIRPFQWSDSDFKNETHIGLPDTWEFGPFKPKWSW